MGGPELFTHIINNLYHVHFSAFQIIDEFHFAGNHIPVDSQNNRSLFLPEHLLGKGKYILESVTVSPEIRTKQFCLRHLTPPLVIVDAPISQIDPKNLRLIIASLIKHQIRVLKINICLFGIQQVNILIVQIQCEIIQSIQCRQDVITVPPFFGCHLKDHAVTGNLQRNAFHIHQLVLDNIRTSLQHIDMSYFQVILHNPESYLKTECGNHQRYYQHHDIRY